MGGGGEVEALLGFLVLWLLVEEYIYTSFPHCADPPWSFKACSSKRRNWLTTSLRCATAMVFSPFPR